LITFDDLVMVAGTGRQGINTYVVTMSEDREHQAPSVIRQRVSFLAV
jgi:hypothetical protein